MFLSTYALIDIGLSEGLSSVILKHARETQAKKISVLPITLLTETVVNQALSQPQNESLKDLIGTAHHDNIDATHNVNSSQDSLESQRVFIEASLNTLQAKLGSNISPASKANIENAKDSLNQQLKVMQTIQKNINDAEKQLATTSAEVDQLATTHDEEWSKYREERLKQLKTELGKVTQNAGLDILPGEMDNFERTDMQEVVDRFVDLSVSKDLPADEMDKLLNISNPDIDTYFRIKAYMAIRSAHPSAEQSTKMMQQLDPFFESSKNEGQKLTAKQKTETASLQEKIKPMVKIAKTSYQELNKLEQDRTILLNRVTSVSDIKSIQEKIEQRTEIRPPTDLHM